MKFSNQGTGRIVPKTEASNQEKIQCNCLLKAVLKAGKALDSTENFDLDSMTAIDVDDV